MTTQPDAKTWSGAVQRELDGLQRGMDTRLHDFSQRLDKLLTLTEYYADKRTIDVRFDSLNEKVHTTDNDIQLLAREVRDSFNTLRHEISTSLAKERDDRQQSIKEYIDTKRSQFRWLVSMVMIPIAIAVVDLVVNGKK